MVERFWVDDAGALEEAALLLTEEVVVRHGRDKVERLAVADADGSLLEDAAAHEDSIDKPGHVGFTDGPVEGDGSPGERYFDEGLRPAHAVAADLADDDIEAAPRDFVS